MPDSACCWPTWANSERSTPLPLSLEKLRATESDGLQGKPGTIRPGIPLRRNADTPSVPFRGSVDQERVPGPTALDQAPQLAQDAALRRLLVEQLDGAVGLEAVARGVSRRLGALTSWAYVPTMVHYVGTGSHVEEDETRLTRVPSGELLWSPGMLRL